MSMCATTVLHAKISVKMCNVIHRAMDSGDVIDAPPQRRLFLDYLVSHVRLCVQLAVSGCAMKEKDAELPARFIAHLLAMPNCRLWCAQEPDSIELPAACARVRATSDANVCVLQGRQFIMAQMRGVEEAIPNLGREFICVIHGWSKYTFAKHGVFAALESAHVNVYDLIDDVFGYCVLVCQKT